MKSKQRKTLFWSLVMLCSVAMIGFGISPCLAQDLDSEGNLVITPEVPEITAEGEVITVEGAEPPVFEESFGPNSQSTWLPSWQFEVNGSSEDWTFFANDSAERYSTSGNGIWSAPVRLPSGARITQVSFFYFDNAAGNNIALQFWRANSQTSHTLLLNTTSPLAGYATTTFFTNLRVDNTGYYYARFDVGTAAGINHRFWGVRIRWQREIRAGLPNPFVDIGGLPAEFQNAITALAASGITTGTTPITFSPFNNVNRAQMAVFLARALGLYWAD